MAQGWLRLASLPGTGLREECWKQKAKNQSNSNVSREKRLVLSQTLPSAWAFTAAFLAAAFFFLFRLRLLGLSQVVDESRSRFPSHNRRQAALVAPQLLQGVPVQWSLKDMAAGSCREDWAIKGRVIVVGVFLKSSTGKNTLLLSFQSNRER